MGTSISTLPFIGEVHTPKEGELARDKFYVVRRWVTCPSCEVGRWTLANRTPKICRGCKSKSVGTNAHGYRVVWVSKDHPFSSMASRGGALLEHRLVMAIHLGRCLGPKEVVHHINGCKTDNRVENLMVMSQSEHRRLHNEERLARLEARIDELERRQ